MSYSPTSTHRLHLENERSPHSSSGNDHMEAPAHHSRILKRAFHGYCDDAWDDSFNNACNPLDHSERTEVYVRRIKAARQAYDALAGALNGEVLVLADEIRAAFRSAVRLLLGEQPR